VQSPEFNLQYHKKINPIKTKYLQSNRLLEDLGMVVHAYNPALGRLKQEDHNFETSLVK
jgi:hypothetical protein